MSKSYQYTKRFIDREVKELNSPLVISPEIREIISLHQARTGDTDESDHDEDESQNTSNHAKLKNIIFKCNVLIRRHNRNVFPSQVINQIVQQILKSEQAKLIKVNENFIKINLILRPILIPDLDDLQGDTFTKLQNFSHLVHELPEAKYLFVEDSNDESEANDENNNNESEVNDENNNEDYENDSDSNLIQDDQEQVPVISKKKLQQTFDDNVARDVAREVSKARASLDLLLVEYETIRNQLLEVNTKLMYKYNKLLYLKQLKQKLVETFNLHESSANDDTTNETPIATVESTVYDSDEEVPDNNTSVLNTSSLSTMTADGLNYDTIRKIQSNLITSTGADDSNNGLYNEINRFRVLVEKLSYKLQNGSSKQELVETLGRVNKQ